MSVKGFRRKVPYEFRPGKPELINAWRRGQEGLPGVFVFAQTKNPSNGSHGNHYAEAARKKKLREATRLACQGRLAIADKMTITLTRLSSGKGLDPFDNLPASLKPVVDGIADAMGIDDRDPRVTWKAEQEKCPRGCFGVRITWV